jgi:hypothetical protein
VPAQVPYTHDTFLASVAAVLQNCRSTASIPLSLTSKQKQMLLFVQYLDTDYLVHICERITRLVPREQVFLNSFSLVHLGLIAHNDSFIQALSERSLIDFFLSSQRSLVESCLFSSHPMRAFDTL